jgi:hypothetical protein
LHLSFYVNDLILSPGETTASLHTRKERDPGNLKTKLIIWIMSVNKEKILGENVTVLTILTYSMSSYKTF